MNQLEKYTKAKEAVEAHIEDNKEIFDAHQKLVFALMDAENELRDQVAIDKKNINNGEYRVVVTPKSQTVYDEEKLLKAIRMTREEAIKDGIIADYERPVQITIGKMGKEAVSKNDATV